MDAPDSDPPLSTHWTVIVFIIVAAFIAGGLASWFGWF